jgi:hypothetical protein
MTTPYTNDRPDGNDPRKKVSPSSRRPSNWIVLQAWQLLALLRRAAQNRADPAEDWIDEQFMIFKSAGNLNPRGQGFIMLKESDDGRSARIFTTDTSADWAVLDGLLAAAHGVKKFKTDVEFRELVLQTCFGEAMTNLIQTGRSHAALQRDRINDLASLTEQPLDGECAPEVAGELDDSIGRPLPKHVQQVLRALIEKAYPIAAQKGLNWAQLFLDDKLGLLVGREPEYQAFTALCEKDRDAAHTWIINVNKWQRFYATKGDSETTANPASA